MTTKMLGALALAIGLAGPALAQTTSQVANPAVHPNANPACHKTKKILNHSTAKGPVSTNKMAGTMADTTSDSGLTTTGASSAAIATGPVDKLGVHSPCAPAVSGTGATGALPNSPPNTLGTH